MKQVSRKLVVFAAVVGLVLANCYAPQVAHASTQAAGLADQSDNIGPIHHNHANAASSCQSDSKTDQGKSQSGSSKSCCLIACSASAFILDAVHIAAAPSSDQSLPSFVDVLVSSHPHAIDPPPRHV